VTCRVELVTKRGELHALDAVELVRRVLDHVLPRGFHRLRHSGLYAPRAKARRERARDQLTARAAKAAPEPETPGPGTGLGSTTELYEQLTGVDLARCPRCDAPLVSSPIRPYQDARRACAELLLRLRGARAPP
jgi:hypothetical protein